MSGPFIFGRIVRHLEAGRRLPEDAVTLVAEDGALPVHLSLSCEDFRPGDLVEIRLLRRDGQAGETARVLAPDGRPLAEPVPYKFTADHAYPVDNSP